MYRGDDPNTPDCCLVVPYIVLQAKELAALVKIFHVSTFLHPEWLMNANHSVHVSPLNTKPTGCMNSQCWFPPRFHHCTDPAIHQQLPTCTCTLGAFPAQHWSLPHNDLPHKLPNYCVCYTSAVVQPLTRPQQISHARSMQSHASKCSASVLDDCSMRRCAQHMRIAALANALSSGECARMQIAHNTLAMCLAWSLHHRHNAV